MNPVLAEPLAGAASDDTDTAISLAFMFQNVAQKITGKARWLGNQQKLRHGENRWMGVFKQLAGKLRIWKFDAEKYMGWAISTHADVIERPNVLISDWLLGKHSEYRASSMADAVVDDRIVRGKLDLIRARMADDVEFLARWQNFLPDYRERLLNQYQSLSPHFLATDVVFMELMKTQNIRQETVAAVNTVLLELNESKWFYQQVRAARDSAIMDAGK